jgi:hypothetical protein
LLIYEDVCGLDNPWMIKRRFTSDSYDHAFSEQAIKTPAPQQKSIQEFISDQTQLFYSKHGLLLMSFINLMGVFALLVFMVSQFHELRQSIDEGRNKVAKLEGLVKVLGEYSEKTKNQESPQLEVQTQAELMIRDLNVRYLGLMHTRDSFKALLELDETTSFFGKGQMIDGHWLIKSFDHSQMILESIKGQQMTILLEK